MYLTGSVPSQPPNSKHHPMYVPFRSAHSGRNLPSRGRFMFPLSLGKELVTKVRKYKGLAFKFPWWARQCTQPHLQAPGFLHHRCQICLDRGSHNASMSCVRAAALHSSSQDSLFCMYRANVSSHIRSHPHNPLKTPLTRGYEANKQATKYGHRYFLGKSPASQFRSENVVHDRFETSPLMPV